MNRKLYFDYITKKLNLFSSEITTRGGLNLLENHVHAEYIFTHLLNLIHSWNLENMNIIDQNFEAIDLIDKEKKIIIQVSATNTKQKIEDTLSKEIMKDYSGYQLYFLFIANKDSSALRKKSFNNPHNLNFSSSNIFDTLSILRKISSLEIKTLKEVYELVRMELEDDINFVNLDRNLTTVINLLAEEEWQDMSSLIPHSFEIEKKITHNNIKRYAKTIQDHAIHGPRISAIFAEFDRIGVNKSRSVLESLARTYIDIENQEPDKVFRSMREAVLEKISSSPNLKQIPIDEIELSIELLIVDAFVRCKIFENPEGYTNAHS